MTQEKKLRLIALTFYVNKSGDITDRIFSHKSLSSTASQRIQFAPALQASKNLGCEICVKSLHSNKPEEVTNLRNYDICLIGKLSSNSKQLSQSMSVANLAAIIRLKLHGSKIAILYCDNLLIDDSEIGDLYKLIFKLADFVIYPTEYLKKIGSKYCSKITQNFVIADPWQVQKLHNPRKKLKKDNWKLIWFGSNKNFMYMKQLFPKLFASELTRENVELTLLTAEWAMNEFHNSNLASKIPKNWSIRLVPWQNAKQPDQLEEELSRAHICIIPSDPDDPRKAGASQNRPVDSIRAGCLTLASPLESYIELSKVCLLGNDFIKMLACAFDQYERLTTKHEPLREKILERFSPEHNSRQWENIFKAIINNTSI